MSNDSQIIKIKKFDSRYYKNGINTNAKYALMIDDSIFFVKDFLSEFGLSKTIIKNTLTKNKVNFHLHTSIKCFMVAFENENDALAAVELFKPNELLFLLRDN